jgi:hypothetical protein
VGSVDRDTILGFVILSGIGWYLLPKPWADRKNTERLRREVERSKAGLPGKPERALLKACTNCRTFALTLPFRDKIGRTYCSAECMSWLAGGAKTFCQRCLQDTSGQSAGDLTTHWSVGKAFGPPQRPCGECGSMLREVRFVVLFLPVRRLGQYRVLHLTRAQFLSRRWTYDVQR